MAIIAHDDKIYILSHQLDLLNTYPAASKDKIEMMFDVRTPFRMDAEAAALADRLQNNVSPKKRKRKKEDPHPFPEELEYLKQQYENFQANLQPKYFPGSATIDEIRANNKELRDYVKSSMLKIDEQFNKNEDMKDEYLVPPASESLLCDISQIECVLKNRTFDIILLDPPWENKHIKRAKLAGTGYKMMQNCQVQNIPVDKYLSSRGVVFIWCSNNARHRDDILSWLKKWNLVTVTKWYWLKVTRYGELTCQFSSHKSPYEVIIIAATKDNELVSSIPKDLVLISVPSAIHSHKPPLQHIINTFAKGLDTRLEIFSRYLQSGWTSLGNESFKLNHQSLFL